MVDIGSVIRAAGVASRLPGRAINGPISNNASPPRSPGARAGAGAPQQALPPATSNNQSQLIDALAQRVAQLESRLAAVESIVQVGIAGTGATISVTGALAIDASTVRINAGSISFESGMTSASGVLRTDTLVATSVVASSYTPGAGNIW